MRKCAKCKLEREDSDFTSIRASKHSCKLCSSCRSRAAFYYEPAAPKVPLAEKLCGKCATVKPIAEFAVKKGYPDFQCLLCLKAYQRAYHKAKNAEKRELRLASEASKAPETERQCCDCKLTLPLALERFRRSKHHLGGFNIRCLLCLRLKERKTPARPVPQPDHKFCNGCTAEKPLAEYRLHQGRPYYVCKSCERIVERKKREANPEKYRAIQARSTENNRESKKARQRKKYAENREMYVQKSREKTARNKALGKPARQASKEYMRAYQKQKIIKDPLYKLAKNLRSRAYHALRSQGFKKTQKMDQYLGCSPTQFRDHLESLFKSGMTWSNYGYGNDKWNIDHIIPISLARNEEELYRLFHYENCQPLWQTENFAKSNKMPDAVC